jgi:hypothetical protein
MKARKILFAGIFSILLPAVVFSQMITLQAKLDSNKILIGDQIKLHLLLNKPKDAKINFPVLPDSLPGGIEIIDRLKPDTLSKNGNYVSLSQSLIITCFDSGQHYIPRIAFEFQHDTLTDTVYTDSLLLTVNTVQVDTTKHAICDIKAPIDEPFSIMEIIEYLIYGLIGLLIIIAGVYVYRKIKKKEPLIKLPQKPADPPHIIALRELDALKEKKLWQNNHIKRYHSDLTEIIRKYIENRFGIPALEMTSYEILDAVSHEKYIPENLHSNLRQMLTLADFVKFAKAIPLPDENDNSIRNAYLFVNNTIPVVKVEETPAKEISGEEKGGQDVN